MSDDDDRIRVPTTKRVDLEQLAEEVGVALSASDTEVVVADPEASITPAQLKAAIDAHMPAPTVDHAAQFTTAVTAIDTSKVTDPAAKVALDAIKAVLSGGKGPGAEPRRPSR